MTTRQDIADALGTVDAITGLPRRPTVYTTGLAWPQVASHDRSPGFYATTWSIYVLAPTDLGAIDDWYDTTILAVRAAIDPELVYIDRDEPVAITLGTATVYAILITARSE